MMIYRFARPWLLINWIYRLTAASKSEKKHQTKLIDFCSKKMEEMRQNIQKNGSLYNQKISLLEYMIQYIIDTKNPQITKEDVIEECCTFMLAGQESVATATAITLFYLSRNSKWQQKCMEELNEIFGEDTRSPIMDELSEMKYLEMCIKESLRLYPTVALFARTLEEDVRVGKIIQGKFAQ
jgi:cytochrome P450 family 4